MVRLPVVARQLLPGLDPAQRVELDAPTVAPHEGVRLARVVNVAEGPAVARGVECRAVAELHDLDRPAGGARTPPGLALGDELPAQLAHLPPRGDGREREEPPALDAAAPDFKVESIQAGKILHVGERPREPFGLARASGCPPGVLLHTSVDIHLMREYLACV